MGQYKDLLAFKKGYELAMEIFTISKRFPPEERYSLTDQIRKSSRSVCTNIVESYRRRRYKDYFISKLNMLKQKMLKHKSGWIFRMTANILPKKNI